MNIFKNGELFLSISFQTGANNYVTGVTTYWFKGKNEVTVVKAAIGRLYIIKVGNLNNTLNTGLKPTVEINVVDNLNRVTKIVPKFSGKPTNLAILVIKNEARNSVGL